jgi:hypothetical protein
MAKLWKMLKINRSGSERTQHNIPCTRPFQMNSKLLNCLVSLVILVLLYLQMRFGIQIVRPLWNDKAQSELAREFSNKCPPLDYQPPFDPFTDFEFRIGTQISSASETDRTDDSATNGSSITDSKSPKTYFSSYHCVGTGRLDSEAALQTDVGSYELRRPHFIDRVCHYRNLYYRISDQSFHYFASPTESQLWKESRELSDGDDAGKEAHEELISRMAVTIGLISETLEAEQLSKFHGTPWKPVLHENSIRDFYDPPANISFAQADVPTYRDRTIFALYHPSHGFNFGHLLWDDLLGIFSLIDRFGYGQDDTVRTIPFFVELMNERTGNNFGGHDNLWRCSPQNHMKWQKCVKMYQRAFAPLTGVQPDRCSGDLLRTGNWLRGENNIGVWKKHEKNNSCWEDDQAVVNAGNERNEPPPGVDYILLANVVAGTGRTGFFGCHDDCAIGRSQEYYRFRHFLFRNMLGPGEACKFHSQRPKGYITFSLSSGSSRPDLISHFEDEIRLASFKYGHEMVRVVDMSSITMVEQARLVGNSAVLVTNHGGVGGVSVFLPRGAAAIVFWHGPRRMEHNWYESAGYFRTVWIGEGERPWINRTMALIDDQVVKTSLEWNGMPRATSVFP